MKYRLSSAADNLIGQPMYKLLSRIKEMERSGKDIVHFEIGDPDFDTPDNIKAAASRALENGNTHYTDSMGLYEFRETIRQHTQKVRGFTPDVEQVVAAPSANSIIYMAVRCLVNPGDDVVVSDPCFPTYTSVLNFCGVNGVGVPLREKNGFRLDVDELESKITPKTRLIIVNSPNNPTGSVMHRHELERVYEVARKHDAFLLSDEVYHSMIYSDIPFYSPSILDRCKERVIVLDGFSKTHAMTGWRLGMVTGPEDFTRKLGLTIQTIVSCVSPFIQEAGIEALTGPQEPLARMMEVYKERRDTMVSGLNDIPGVFCHMPDGALYCFANITGTGMDSQAFADFALDAGVGLLPGTDFGPSGEGFIRLCYATSTERIKEGIKRLKDALSEKL